MIMKKILLSMVCLMMMGMQSVQAQVAIAALHHNDSVKIYSASGLQNAINDAVEGDTIYLSEGMFGGFTVTKPIAIIGAGQTTSISSNVTIGKSGNTIEDGLLLSGLNIVQDVTFIGNVSGVRISQCNIAVDCDMNNSSSYSFDNIEILMSKIGGLLLANAVKGLTVVASKISRVNSDGADEGSVTILNCNVNDSNKGYSSGGNNNFVNCIIGTAGPGVYQNCLYKTTYSNYPVLYDCYQNSDFTLDDDLNCSLTDDELKAAGYVGVDNTWVGINGGEVQYSLVMPVVQVTEHSVEVDQTERKLKVSLKLGNK